MSGVLIVADASAGELGRASLELIAAARELSAQGAGPVAVALVGRHADTLAFGAWAAGVEEIVVVPTPEKRPEAHVSEAALLALIDVRTPSVVLAANTIDSLSYAPAVAARAQLGFATEVTGVSWGEHGVLARRAIYGERLLAELDFPGKRTVVLLAQLGAFDPASALEPAASPARIVRFEHGLEGTARSEHVASVEPPRGDVDVAAAGFLLSIGRGVERAENIPRLERLAELMGATLAVSGPLVEAGWASGVRKVGQSGRTVSPRVYLALGISGAAQHLAGVSGARAIIAVNSDANARIFDVADYGVVADLFEVATELERQLGG